MFIAFEGPDNVGKSTNAARLAYDGRAIYNVTKEIHDVHRKAIHPEPDQVVTYDRIDWFSHMVYRLALPDREWNDARVRTVFAMPDTHLVVKIHETDLADFTADEVVDTPIKPVNEMYYHQAVFYMALNERWEYKLFKSISIMLVHHTEDEYSQRLIAFDSAPFNVGDVEALDTMPSTDDELVEWLRRVEQHS